MIVKIKKGQMLAGPITLWDILQMKIEVEFEFIIPQVHSQMFHKPGSQPLHEKVQEENESRLAYIQFHLFMLRMHIIKSHKSL